MNSVRPCTECSRRVASRACAARHLAVVFRLEKPSPSLPPALSIHSLPLPSHSLFCSPSVSLTVSCSAWPSSRAAASLAPPLPRHHRAFQHRLRVCFRRLDRLPNPSSAAVRCAVVGTTAAAAACRRTHGQEGHGLQLAVPLARRGRGYALPSPPRRYRLSRPCPAGPSCDMLQSLKKRTPGTSRSNSRKGKVLTAKSVTQMNSADKDPFAVILLNLWKFIVIYRKFVK